MKRIIVLCVVICSLFISGCGQKDLAPPSNTVNAGQMPDWYIVLPVSEGILYETATEVSQDLQMAFDKAELKAIKNMSGKNYNKFIFFGN